MERCTRRTTRVVTSLSRTPKTTSSRNRSKKSTTTSSGKGMKFLSVLWFFIGGCAHFSAAEMDEAHEQCTKAMSHAHLAQSDRIGFLAERQPPGTPAVI